MSMLKTIMLLNTTVETVTFFPHLFQIYIFCYIIHVFNVTFSHLNASLLNKSIVFFSYSYRVCIHK